MYRLLALKFNERPALRGSVPDEAAAISEIAAARSARPAMTAIDFKLVSDRGTS